MPDNVALFATVILLLPMFYFLLAAPAFLLVKLEVLQVARLLRGMFNSYLLILAITGAIGTAAVLLEGRWGLALALGAITAIAWLARGWVLAQMDFPVEGVDAVDADVAKRMRRLHWAGMAGNAAQLAAVVACIPYISVVPA